jgi:hypothetical protein
MGIHRQGGFRDPYGCIWLAGGEPPLQPVHRITVISLDSAPCPPPSGVLVEGRDERKPGGFHDIGGRRADRNPAARQFHLELDLSDGLAARAD